MVVIFLVDVFRARVVEWKLFRQFVLHDFQTFLKVTLSTEEQPIDPYEEIVDG